MHICSESLLGNLYRCRVVVEVVVLELWVVESFVVGPFVVDLLFWNFVVESLSWNLCCGTFL